jgi:hypothetical protein
MFQNKLSLETVSFTFQKCKLSQAWLRKVSKCFKAVVSEVNMQMSTAFLYTGSEQMEYEI